MIKEQFELYNRQFNLQVGYVVIPEKGCFQSDVSGKISRIHGNCIYVKWGNSETEHCYSPNTIRLESLINPFGEQI